VEHSEYAEALAFAERVVMPQGAIFIRELLRQKRTDRPAIRIGISKEEVKENLRIAIRSGAVTQADLERFISAVEGWGNQHVYLFDPGPVADLRIWKSVRNVQKALAAIGHNEIWQKTDDPSFPEELVAASASFRDGCFELLWRAKDEHWWRDAARDKPREEIDGDLYEFRAYRQELKRSVMRFVLFPASRKAALFVQIPLGKRHIQALATARHTLDGLFRFGDMRATDISTAVKVLDTRDLDAEDAGKHGHMKAQNTKFEAEGATVEFDADPTIGAWKQVTAVRRVRRALRTDAFRGQSGRFVVNLRLGPGLNRDVVMSLNGDAGRIYLQAQLNFREVWTILDQVLSACLPSAPP